MAIHPSTLGAQRLLRLWRHSRDHITHGFRSIHIHSRTLNIFLLKSRSALSTAAKSNSCIKRMLQANVPVIFPLETWLKKATQWGIIVLLTSNNTELQLEIRTTLILTAVMFHAQYQFKRQPDGLIPQYRDPKICSRYSSLVYRPL